MIYFAVKNVVSGNTEYFVPDEVTRQANDHLVCIVGTQEDAVAKANQNKQSFLEQESYRFSIAKEVVDGNNTTWMNADLVNDVEDGSYHVFNQATGQYEGVVGLSNAINRMAQLKDEFLAQFDWSVHELTNLPTKNAGTYPREIYGQTVGTIPVEVM